METRQGLYYFVYIATNPEKSSLYIGVAGDLGVRLYQLEYDLVYGHDNNDRKDRFTLLLYWEKFEDAVTALDRQRQLNSWSKKRKISLVNTTNPKWEPQNHIIFQGGYF